VDGTSLCPCAVVAFDIWGAEPESYLHKRDSLCQAKEKDKICNMVVFHISFN
jgi:hypothetical protein